RSGVSDTRDVRGWGGSLDSGPPSGSLRVRFESQTVAAATRASRANHSISIGTGVVLEKNRPSAIRPAAFGSSRLSMARLSAHIRNPSAAVRPALDHGVSARTPWYTLNAMPKDT